MTITPFEEYAALMNRNGDGYYLYKPQPYTKIHPGVIGYFDRHGNWTTITDLSIPGQPEKDGYARFTPDFDKDKPGTATWNTRASSSEAEHSFGVTGGLSGALSSMPIDVSAEAKNKWGQTGKAALIADKVVIQEKYRGPWETSIVRWVKANAKAIAGKDSAWCLDVKKYGLWAINKTWSTEDCKITMDSAHSRDTSGGFGVGATGIAKGGIDGSSSIKSDNQGWTTFKASEDDQGLVVSYGGSGFRLSSFTKLFTKALLKQTESRAFVPNEFIKPIFDENGTQIGAQRYRIQYDENGNEFEELIDEEAERKKKDEADRKLIEDGDAEEVVDIDFSEAFGQTEEELAAAKEEEAQQTEDAQKVLNEKIAAIMAQDLTDDLRAAALQKLLTTENVVYETRRDFA